MTFAPTIPSNAGSTPTYLKLSDSIKQPGADDSKKILLGAAGDVASGAIALADQQVKHSADQDVQAGMDALQQQKTEDLTTTIQAATKGTVSDEHGNPVNLTDLFNKPKDDRFPSDIKNIETIMNNLRTAKDHGQYSDTYYRMQVDKFAKELRAKYPAGYRPYIDEKIRGMEGSTANELNASMIHDLNAALQGTKKNEDEKIMGKMLEHTDIPVVVDSILKIRRGESTPDEGLQVLGRALAPRRVIADRKDQMEQDARERGLSIQQVEELGTRQARNTFMEQWNGVAMLHSPEPGKTGWNTPQEAVADLGRRALNNDLPKGQEFEQLNTVFRVAETNYTTQMNKWGDTIYNPRDPKEQQKSYRDFLGGTKFNQLMTDGLKELTELRRLYFNNDYAAIAAGHRQYDSMVRDTSVNMMQTVPQVTQMAAVNHIMGNQAASQFLTNIFKLGQGAALSENIQRWSTSKAVDAILNPPNHLNYNARAMVDEASTRGYDGRPVGVVINSITSALRNPETAPDAMFNAVGYMFGPGTQTFFEKIPESTKTIEGQVVPGRTTIFRDVFSKDILENIHRQSNPNLWEETKRTATLWAGKYLLPTQIKDLTNIQQKDIGSDMVDIHYDPVAHQFEVRPKNLMDFYRGEPGAAPGRSDKARNYTQQDLDAQAIIARGAVNKINVIIKTLASIAETEHTDPNDYITKQLMTMGYSPAGGKNPLVDAVRGSLAPTPVSTEKPSEKDTERVRSDVGAPSSVPIRVNPDSYEEKVRRLEQDVDHALSKPEYNGRREALRPGLIEHGMKARGIVKPE